MRKNQPTPTGPTGPFADLYTPETAAAPQEEEGIAARLLKAGVIGSEQLANAQRLLKDQPGRSLGDLLIELGADEVAVTQVVAEVARLPFERVDARGVDAYDAKSLHRLGPKYCGANLVLPLRREGSRLVVGTARPDDVFVLDDVKRKLAIPAVKHVLVPPADIKAVIETLGEPEAEEYDVEQILTDVDEDDVEVVEDKTQEGDANEAESSPIVRFVNHIIQAAVKEGASDIHIEPEERALKVRFRIDGVLFDTMHPPKKMHAPIISRIKIMANLDIAERRLPQDGRIRVTVLSRKLDLRVSTVPASHGEKVVMRILDTRSINVTLDQLGFGEETLAVWKDQIAQPHGIILVTGPTGSGKTTTLYASIQQMDTRRLNVSTVEDPVEFNIPNINQIQTHEKIGMNFATALRSLLRQDPDVILVGEVRDMETATVAIQAALTGHLVLSTLHTNDAPSSITRLINIGIEPFLVGAALRAVLAQRLVRRICEHCKHQVRVKPELAKYLEMHNITAARIMEGKGCSRCRETKYGGRVGIYELLILDDHLRDAIARNPNVTEFSRMCTGRGMVTLRQDGFKKVAAGVTTIEEVLRVTEATA